MPSITQLLFSLLPLATLLVVPAIALILGFLPVSRRRLTVFAALHGVTVTTANGPVLIRYLSRSMRWRSVSGTIGWMAGAAIAGPSGTLFGGAVGYLAGAFVAELRSSVRRAPGPRRALLVKRHSRDYLSWGVQWGPVLVLAVVLLQGLGELLWPRDMDARPWTTLLYAGFVAGMAAVLGLSRRLIVGRPLPVVAPDLAAADSAIRRSSLQIIGGAALAIMCLAPSGVIVQRSFELADSAPVGWFYGLTSLLLFLGAIYSWFGVKARSRRVRLGETP